MKKILWFSRHDMTEVQKSDLENIFKSTLEINQVNKTVRSAFELADEAAECDIAVVVMPLNLQQQMLKVLNGKPMLIARSHRIQQPDGSFEFVHAGFDKISKIEIIKEELSDIPAPEGAFRQ